MPVTIANRPTLGVPQKPLRRSNKDAILGGVAEGYAVRLGLKERTVRIFFSLSALVAGIGVLAYITLWLLLPRSGEDQSIAQRLASHRRDKQLLLLVPVVALVLLVGLDQSLRFGGLFTWTVLLSLVGAIGVWRGSSPDERVHLEEFVSAAPFLGAASARGWRSVFVRVVPGIVLVVVGLNILNQIGAAVPALIGAMILVGGLSVLLMPWWLHTVRDLSVERRQRVRMEERSAIMAHIHDSVLQTLTLIERSAANESDVVRLARAQERELRQWLFNPELFTTGGGGPTSFAVLVRAIEDEIENDYGVKVELVVVGDCAASGAVVAMVAAGREAAINAAKWSEATTISIYAEVESNEVSMFIRDTGKGFDVNAVPSDRHGIEISIRQRMRQFGGVAKIRSTLSAGTEVQLGLSRPASN
jgi:signal transduction histidine kinase